jgi:glutamine synthetase
MATDLEQFVDQPGRVEAVAEVARRIDAEGITYVYFQFVSVTGRVMGKGIPAAHWSTVATKGFQLVYGATANLFIDRHGQYLGYGPEAAELVGLPDVDTFCPLPWDPKVARVFCTLFRGREEKVDPGAFLSSDCRGNLRRLHQEFTAETGLHLRVGCEPEMMWLKTNPDGTPSVEGVTKPYCYHIDQFSELQPVIHRVIEYATAMGLDMIQGDHEDAPGQLELNFTFDRAEVTADRLTTYRQVCRQVGREFDLFPCFMPKPFMGVSANGCHHNISLWEDDVNMFLPDGDDPRLPSKTGLSAIGGVLTHLRALTAITAPTVNSYRRFADAGFWAP